MSIPVATVKVLTSEPASYGCEIVSLLNTDTSEVLIFDGSYVGILAIASTLPVLGSMTIALALVALLRLAPASSADSTCVWILRSIVKTILWPFTAGWRTFLSPIVSGTSRASVTVLSMPSRPDRVWLLACSKPYTPFPS